MINIKFYVKKLKNIYCVLKYIEFFDIFFTTGWCGKKFDEEFDTI